MDARTFQTVHRLRAIRWNSGDGCNSGRCCVYARLGSNGSAWYCGHPDACRRVPGGNGGTRLDPFAFRVSVDPGMDNVCDGFAPLGPEESTP
jgi:hypothetical protein